MTTPAGTVTLASIQQKAHWAATTAHLYALEAAHAIWQSTKARGLPLEYHESAKAHAAMAEYGVGIYPF